MVYLVPYDPIKQNDYAFLIEEIKKSPGWARISDSTWGVETNETAQELFERLRPKVTDDDRLVIVQLQKGFTECATGLSANVAEWLARACERA
jgi:hypothetical protein